MSVPAKSSPSAASAARGLADRAKEEVEALVEGFKAKSRYFQWKAYIAAAYALVAVITLVVALWGEGNALGAEVRTIDGLIGASVSVTNTSDEDWTDVELTLNGLYKYRIKTVPPTRGISMLVSDFQGVGKNGKPVRAPKDLVPMQIEIKCAEGEVALPFEKK